MTKNILLVGVGGQGTILASKILTLGLQKANYNVKMSEIHGMSQRGGDVQSNLRLSSELINSDLIPLGGANLIISLEPMEALRYLPYLDKEGWIITNTAPFVNIDNYPDAEELKNALANLPRVIAIDVDGIAKQVASPRAANIVLLGAAAPFLGIDIEELEEGIRTIFGRKGEQVVEMNIKALRAGCEYAQQNIK